MGPWEGDGGGPRDCASLARQGGRTLLYAACRDLQGSGETMRSEGLLYRPDEIMEYVTEEEAAHAVRTVRALSGMEPEEPEDGFPPAREDGKDFPEVRLDSVRKKEPGFDSGAERLLEVGRDSGIGPPEIRLDSVRSDSPEPLPEPHSPLEEIGQASREFSAPQE